MKTSGSWVPGQSGNPRGRPKKLEAMREALDDERDPDKLREMLRALFARGVDGDNFAAKVWLEYVCPLKDQGLPDLSSAPDEVVDWLNEQRIGEAGN